MPRTSVKNMSRQQQKAVFASMGNVGSGNPRTFESAEDGKKRRELMLKRHEHAEGRSNSMHGREKLYKDAYATKEEAVGIKEYLEDEGKKNVFVFKDKGGDWNIAYDNSEDAEGRKQSSNISGPIKRGVLSAASKINLAANRHNISVAKDNIKSHKNEIGTLKTKIAQEKNDIKEAQENMRYMRAEFKKRKIKYG